MGHVVNVNVIPFFKKAYMRVVVYLFQCPHAYIFRVSINLYSIIETDISLQRKKCNIHTRHM